ncbi:MAG: fluoride efflux transporter CrcB [Anaerovoracaceae bacterium]
MLFNCLAVGAGGFIGSVFRYLIGLIPFLNRHDIPYHTLLINVIGAIIIGMIVKSSETCQWINGNFLLFMKVGVCGGFTTFSTFSLESLGLIEGGKIILFCIYAAASVSLCILGVFVGKWIMGSVQ